MSFPNMADTSVNCVPTNCIPSPLSPQKRMTTTSTLSTLLSPRLCVWAQDSWTVSLDIVGVLLTKPEKNLRWGVNLTHYTHRKSEVATKFVLRRRPRTLRGTIRLGALCMGLEIANIGGSTYGG